MKTFPYTYYFYGSADSTDKDVIIVVPKKDMPNTQEERKRLVLELQHQYNLSWNATLAVIENNVMTDTIYTKSWIDSLNNALLRTYDLHEQHFPLLICQVLKRNKTLAIYKAVRTILTFLTRTKYRTEIKSVLKGVHDFNLKIKVLKRIDFISLNSFNQKNATDLDIWKIITFYVVQNKALLIEDIEIYTKKEAVDYAPESYRLVYRKNLHEKDKIFLQNTILEWLSIIENFGIFNSMNGMLQCNNELIDMINEKY
ncbi:conserved hypothetical protein [Flavobacterium sp. 9AF]|uniref:hypothetical protein n=1 Tax=Flavobacterium sp. 9AF TaxID=2653142 RepID=UPI0012EF8C8C|nr:hypothetical protein [Flavobacterium sp. 9AF]VXB85246.1 conserved hypothetical protein [Flavobacterium sp. 9AF]